MRETWIAVALLAVSFSMFWCVGCESNPDGPSAAEAVRKAEEAPDHKPPAPTGRRRGAPSSVQSLEMIEN